MDDEQISENDQVAPVETSANESVERVEDSQERNWRELNRAKKELEKKAKMQEEWIEKLMKYQNPHQPAVQTSEIDELDSIPDDDHLVKSQSRKLVKKEVAPLQKRIDELEQQLHRQSEFNRLNSLKSKFSDFDEVVNPETLAILEEQEPELAQTICELKDPYKIGVQSYKYIKALNISDKIPASRRSKEVERKIESNKKVVQSPQAFDKRPMAQAFKMSEEEKSKLYEEMMRYASQAGFAY